MPLERTHLMVNLAQMDQPVMYGKLLELRALLQEWLSYIPHTFPHYTRHTVGHSDEILGQLSALLYEDSAQQPVIPLSAAEIYCLVASAYLHDAGMVVSDQERIELLGSKEWNEWATDGPGETRWRQIQELIDLDRQESTLQRRFAIDLEIRFLIADYLRRQHHTRAGQIIRLENGIASQFSMGNPAVSRTIADICEGHGLSWQELSDTERYPFRRDLPGGSVNVRLMTILLRLGDLLDMSSDRACPLLFAAASPLPADSIAHWSQYQRIVHRLTASDRIEITAECETQTEHRVIHDWLQWIVNEVTNSPLLLRDSARHAAWKPPAAQLTGPSPSLVVRPSAGANYVPADWTFQLDSETVLQRLITDAYTDELSFVRELIQNAADASRCEIQRTASGEARTSRWPDADRAAEFGITVSVTESSRVVSSSGEPETYSIITVEDHGIGMDAHIIQNYLLQVGRSYYTSTQFRREYGFIPASRFGIGFLSVFAISDHVVVETYKASAPGPTPLKLTLTGPQNYILLERGTLTNSGTLVEVALRGQVDVDQLKQQVAHWCKMLEFPVTFRDEISPRSEEIFTHEQPNELERQLDIEGGHYDQYRIRAFPIDTPKIQGHWYINEVREADTGQWRWDVRPYQIESAALERASWPINLPDAVSPLLSFHGITVYPKSNAFVAYMPTLRLDYRTSQEEMPTSLNRQDWSPNSFPPENEELISVMLDIIETHFNEVGADLQYKQAVSDADIFPQAVRYRIPGCVRVMTPAKTWKLISLAELASARDLTILPSPWPREPDRTVAAQTDFASRRQDLAKELAGTGDLLILEEDAGFNRRTRILNNSRIPFAAHRASDGTLAVTLRTGSRSWSALDEAIFFSSLTDISADIFAARLYARYDSEIKMIWVNTSSVIFRWFCAALNEEFAEGTVIYLSKYDSLKSRRSKLHTVISWLLVDPPTRVIMGELFDASPDNILDQVVELAGPDAPPRPSGALVWQGRYLMSIE